VYVEYSPYVPKLLRENPQLGPSFTSLTTQYHSCMMHKESPYRDALSTVMGTLIESGILQFLTERYIPPTKSKCIHTVIASEQKLENFHEAFLLLGLGLLFGSVCLLAELISNLLHSLLAVFKLQNITMMLSFSPQLG